MKISSQGLPQLAEQEDRLHMVTLCVTVLNSRLTTESKYSVKSELKPCEAPLVAKRRSV